MVREIGAEFINGINNTHYIKITLIIFLSKVNSIINTVHLIVKTVKNERALFFEWMLRLWLTWSIPVQSTRTGSKTSALPYTHSVLIGVCAWLQSWSGRGLWGHRGLRGHREWHSGGRWHMTAFPFWGVVQIDRLPLKGPTGDTKLKQSLLF